MKPLEISEGNKLIALFMGGELSIHESLKDQIINIGFKWYFTEHHAWNSRNLCYHESWDWLMPVVEKIASQDWSGITIEWGTGCTDSFAHCEIDYNVGKRSFKTSEDLNSDEQSLITAVYLAVVEFTKWFNQK